MARAPPLGFFLLSAVALFVWFIFATRDHERSMPNINVIPPKYEPALSSEIPHLAPEVRQGSAIMPKLGNETAKAELGRAAWKLFHTIMARFPDAPAQDERDALKSYIYLFARLYPCGECAAHFQQIIKRFPPQTSSRSTAAAWACHVHNEVNKSRGKALFDCGNIGDFYDCGCEEDESQGGKKKISEAERTDNDDSNKERASITISKEGLTKGG